MFEAAHLSHLFSLLFLTVESMMLISMLAVISVADSVMLILLNCTYYFLVPYLIYLQHCILKSYASRDLVSVLVVK